MAYFLKSRDYWQQIADNTSGIAIPNVNASKISDIRLPLAPLALQRRIVAEIEKQFSRLDQAVASLQRVKAQLKRYKASVLKAAVEGRLVETEAERPAAKAAASSPAPSLLHREVRMPREAGSPER
ncbi:type I restriction modification system, specificity subunit, partial [mine drainage metagenome]